jgi:hypothetical protein
MDFDFEAAVDVGFAEDLSYSDMAPVLDAFGVTSVFRVNTSRVGWSGPAAGGPEIGIVLTAVAAVGGAAFAKTFCEELAKDAYKAVRSALIGIVRQLRERDPETVRAVVPLSIRVGDVNICIGGSLHEPDHTDDEWTDEWLLERLRQAQAIVDAEFGRQYPTDGPPIGPRDPCEHWLG